MGEGDQERGDSVGISKNESRQCGSCVCNPSNWASEDQTLKTSLSYIINSGPAWATKDLISTNKLAGDIAQLVQCLPYKQDPDRHGDAVPLWFQLWEADP